MEAVLRNRYASPKSSCDVVFVHGLGSDTGKTWKPLESDGFWPDWLAAEGLNCSVWDLSYPTSKLQWLDKSEKLFVSELGGVAMELAVLEGLGTKPIVWITHSLGGLIVKHGLVAAASYGGAERQKVVEASRSVVFLGTPHQGSAIATIAQKLRWLAKPSRTTLNLIKNNHELIELNKSFAGFAVQHDIRVKAFYETEPIGAGFYVVDRNSADPHVPGASVTAVPGTDHSQISQPSGRKSIVFKACTREIRESSEVSAAESPKRLQQWAANSDSHNESGIRRFLEGAQPRRGVVSDHLVPQRSQVDEAVQAVVDAQANSQPGVCLILGGVGDGKSTVLLQAAERLFNLGWNVWEPSDRTQRFDAKDLAELDDDNSVVLMEDLASAARELHSLLLDPSSRPMQVLATVNERDWKRSKFNRLAWEGTLTTVDVGGLARTDADAIVGAWTRHGLLGELAETPESDRPARLIEACQRRSHGQAPSLYGGMLAVRFTEATLRERLSALMESLADPEFDALGYVALAESLGVDGLKRSVLADCLGMTETEVHTKVLQQLGREAVGSNSQYLVRSRHKAVAKAIVWTLHHFDEDLFAIADAIVARTIAQQTSLLDEDRRWYVSLVHCGPRAVRELTRSGLTRSIGEDLAVHVARRASQIERHRLDLATTHVRTLREARRFEEAIERSKELDGRPRDSWEDWGATGRGLYFEWSVNAALLSRRFGASAPEVALYNMHLGVVMSCLSLSDAYPDLGLDLVHAKTALAGLGADCLELAAQSRQHAECLAAVPVLGRLAKPDKKSVGYFRRHSDLANELGVPSPDAPEAIATLARTYSASHAELPEDATLPAGTADSASFERLATTLGISG